MRLAFPSGELGRALGARRARTRAESEAEAEEGCRLVYVAATRAEDRLILSGALQARATSSRPSSRSRATRRCGGCCPRWSSAASTAATARSSCPGPSPGRRHRAGCPTRRLRIRVSEPGAERAAELVRSLPAPRRGRPAGDRERARPRCSTRAPAPVPLGHLSYSALAAVRALRLPLLRRAGARSREALAARRRRRGRPSEAGRPAPSELAEPPPTRRGAGAAGLGNAVHAALEWSARATAGSGPPTERLADAARPRGAERRRRRGRARRAAGRRLARLRAARRARRTRAAARGALRARARRDRRPRADRPARRRRRRSPTVVDYKTDALRGRAPAELGERYAVQRQVYALAAGGGDRSAGGRTSSSRRPTSR